MGRGRECENLERERKLKREIERKRVGKGVRGVLGYLPNRGRAERAEWAVRAGRMITSQDGEATCGE